MKYAPYSASKLGLHKQCPRKFKYRYIDKLPSEFEFSEATTKGGIMHLLLEHYAKPLKERIQEIKKDKRLTSSEFFSKEMVASCIADIEKFNKSDLGKEIFSYQNLVNELKIGLDKRLKPVDFYDNDVVMFRGMIDAIFVNTEDDVVHIIDWKSGGDKSTGQYKQTPDQLLQYAAFYFNKFPIDTIKIRYVFVEHCTESTYTLTRDNLEKYNKFLVKNIIKAEQDNIFDKIEQPLCNWCEFRDHCISDV